MARLRAKLRHSSLGFDERGFTLIELLTAMVILAIGLLGTAALTTGVVRGNLSSKNITTATTIARSCLEENRRVGYANAGAAPVGGSNNCVSGSTTLISGGVSYTRNLSIDASVSNIKTLSVSVSWSEGSVGVKSLTLKTVMAAS